MDPFITTILKQAGLIVLMFAAAGVLVAALYGLSQYAKLQHALTLNTLPPSLP